MDVLASTRAKLHAAGVPEEYSVLGVALITISVLLIASFLVSGWCFFGNGKTSIGRKRNATLLVGLCDSGKTSLFYRLFADTMPDCVSSIEPCDKTFPLFLDQNSPRTSVRVIDFPGHTRLRPQLLSLIPTAKQIVFVVDATRMESEVLHELADLLYDVFTECIRHQREPPVLIACNKSDLAGAISPEKVRGLLEKEMENLKGSRHTLETEGDQGAEIILGAVDAPFDFNVDAGCNVEFCSISVKKGGDNLDPVIDFIVDT